MEIEYSLNPGDLPAFTRYHRKLGSVRTAPSLSAVLGVVIIAMLIVGLGLLLPAFLFDGEGLVAAWMGLAIGYFGILLIQRWWQACMNRSIHKAHCEDPRSEWTVRDVQVVLSSNQVRTVARGATSVYEWSRVWHIGETDKHVFLCITRNTAIIIPRRAFRDNQHFEEFISLARQYRQDRGQQAPKPTSIITSLPPQSDAFTRPDAP